MATTAMKLSQGFTQLLSSILMIVFYVASFSMLNLALRNIAVSVAYAIWSSFGIAIIATISIFWFHEPVTLFKMISLGLIIIGVVGLNLSGGTTHERWASTQILR